MCGLLSMGSDLDFIRRRKLAQGKCALARMFTFVRNAARRRRRKAPGLTLPLRFHERAAVSNRTKTKSGSLTPFGMTTLKTEARLRRTETVAPASCRLSLATV